MRMRVRVELDVCFPYLFWEGRDMIVLGIVADDWLWIDAEAVQITYDPKQITYGQLLEYFYKMHDPTTKDSQGPDRGTQYRSAIFYHGPEQEKVARDITKKVDEQWWKGKVVTQILEGGPMHIGKLSDEEISKLPVNSRWYDAEEYHQKYLTRRPGGYECPSHFLRKFPPLS